MLNIKCVFDKHNKTISQHLECRFESNTLIHNIEQGWGINCSQKAT